MTHPFLHDARLIAVEVGAQPVDDLLDAADLLPAFLRTQRRVGGEQHARIERDRRALAEPGERCDQQPFLAERLPVAHRVVMEDRKSTRLNFSHYCASRMPFSV